MWFIIRWSGWEGSCVALLKAGTEGRRESIQLWSLLLVGQGAILAHLNLVDLCVFGLYWTQSQCKVNSGAGMWITNGLHVLVGALPLLLAANLCLSVLGTQAGFVLDAYRLVQMDVDGAPLGSRSVRLAQVTIDECCCTR